MTDPEHQQQQISELTRQSQEAIATAARAWAETVKQVTGALPQLAERTPDVTQLVDRSFAFAHQLLDAQQQVTHTLLQALVPSGTDAAGAAAGGAARFADNVASGTTRMAERVSGTVLSAAENATRAATRTARAAGQTAENATRATTTARAAGEAAEDAGSAGGGEEPAGPAEAPATGSESAFADNLAAGTGRRRPPSRRPRE